MSASAEELTNRKRARCRRAGIESGRVRRYRGLRRRGLTPGPETRGLELTWELRRIGRREFDRRYEAMWPRPDWPAAAASWERGRSALWQHLMGCYALVCARGQHCGTTNGQRGIALSSRGLPRCRRSVQYYNRRLEALGILGALHVRGPRQRDGSRGKDFLRIEWRVTRRLLCTPPTGTVNPCLRQGGLPPFQQRTASSAPPSAADLGPPGGPAEQPVSEEEGLAAQIQFQQLMLDLGIGDPVVNRAKIGQLGRELRDLIGASSSEGFRCSM